MLIGEVGGILSFKGRTDSKGEAVLIKECDEDKNDICNDFFQIKKGCGVSFDCAGATRANFNKYLKSIKYRIK